MNPVVYLETGVLHCGDNARLLGQLPEGCVDLIYLDPPFFSNRNYEVIWGDEAEVRSFEDRWAGGIQHYIDWMEPRLRLMQRMLKPTGSIYLHCDPSASHHLKVLMDDLFELRHFRNEIIWRRYGAHNDVGQGSKHFGRVHDSILFYAKSSEAWWDQQFTPLSPEYIESTYRYVEKDTGRRFTTKPLTAPGGAAKGNPTYDWNGHTRFWRYSKETMQKLHDEGRLYYSKTGYVRQKHYLDESRGVPVQDLWTDVPALVGDNDERLGFPTQKPEALMERIIESSCPPGGVVLDPFCGCGTTIAVAHRLKREWIGIDISPTAVNLMKRRMNKLGATAKTEGLPTTAVELKALKPFEFQNWVIQRVLGTQSPRKSGDMGIDGYSFFEQLPIQVKQSERVGRNVVDNFETAVERSGKHMGYIVAFSFTKGAFEEVARAHREGRVSIVLVKVEDLIRVGELIEAADAHSTTPNLASETPDLMRLFKSAEERSPDHGLPLWQAPPRSAVPKNKDLIESARETAPA